ncbi:WD40-repeat-containing domain protein [Chytriomyces sp. MP71]|nr:WD40-repeat-containing domain protein [Chytriomyces sp. MP71]
MTSRSQAAAPPPATTRVVALSGSGNAQRVSGWGIGKRGGGAYGHAAFAVDIGADRGSDLSALVWNTDASMVACVSTREVRLGSYSIVTATQLSSTASTELIAAAAFGPRRASRYLYVAVGCEVVVWDTRDHKVTARYGGHAASVSAIALNVDETHLASADSSGRVRVHSLKTNTSMSLQCSHLSQTITHCAFSPFKKSTLAAAGDDGALVVWDFTVSATEPSFVVKNAHAAPLSGLCWSPCNKALFVTAGLDRRVLVCNKDERGKILLKFETDSPVTSLSVNDDFLIAAGTLSGQITLFDVRARKAVLTFQANPSGESVTGLEFEPPQWAQETSQRDQGGHNSSTAASIRLTSKPAPSQPLQTSALVSEEVVHSVTSMAPLIAQPSGSPVVAAFKERMAAVKEKQSGLMELFSPVKSVPTHQDSDGGSKLSSTDLKESRILSGASSKVSSIAGLSSLREVVSALSDDEDEAERDVKRGPLFGLAQKQKSLTSENGMEGLFSPLQSVHRGQEPGPNYPSQHTPTRSLSSEPFDTSTNPFLSKQSSTTSSTENPISRLQNALHQLKAKTPNRSTTPTNLIAQKSEPVPPVLSVRQDELVNIEATPRSVLQGANVSAGSSSSSLARNGSAERDDGLSLDPYVADKTVVKNLPGAPQFAMDHAIGMSESDGGYADRGEFKLVVPVSVLAPTVAAAIDVDEEEDVWTTREVLGEDWQSSGGLIGQESQIMTESLPALKGVSGKAFSTADDTLLASRSATFIDASGQGGNSSGFAHKVLEAVLESCLEDFRTQVKEEIQNMHVELLRQFMIQKQEINDMFNAHSPTEELLKEVVRLREENARLRCGF